MPDHKPRLFAIGYINAFFGLMLDNMVSLVIMAAILLMALFPPLAPPSPIVWHLAAGYAVMALTFGLLERGRDRQAV